MKKWSSLANLGAPVKHLKSLFIRHLGDLISHLSQANSQRTKSSLVDHWISMCFFLRSFSALDILCIYIYIYIALDIYIYIAIDNIYIYIYV